MSNEPDMDAVGRVVRATCAHLHDLAVRSGYLTRTRMDPGQYRSREVAPIIRAAFETGLITEVKR